MVALHIIFIIIVIVTVIVNNRIWEEVEKTEIFGIRTELLPCYSLFYSIWNWQMIPCGF